MIIVERVVDVQVGDGRRRCSDAEVFPLSLSRQSGTMNANRSDSVHHSVSPKRMAGPEQGRMQGEEGRSVAVDEIVGEGIIGAAMKIREKVRRGRLDGGAG